MKITLPVCPDCKVLLVSQQSEFAGVPLGFVQTCPQCNRERKPLLVQVDAEQCEREAKE